MSRLRLSALAAGLVALLPATAAAQNYGTIKGQVVLSKAPAPKEVDVTVDKAFCQSKGKVVDESLIVGKEGGVQYVMVWLRPDSTDRAEKFPADKVHPDLAKAAPAQRVIDQPCCQFIPRVLAGRAGDTLVVKNSAQVNHNINFTSDSESFNVNIPPGGKHSPSKPLEAQNTKIVFKCDVHPWMKGEMRVFDHPYFAVTDDKGNFEIKNAPYGKWRIVFQHETGYHKGREGSLGFPIEVNSPTLEYPKVEFQSPSIKAGGN